MIPSFCLTRLNHYYNTDPMINANQRYELSQADIDALDAEDYAVFLATGDPASEERLAPEVLELIEEFRCFDL